MIVSPIQKHAPQDMDRSATNLSATTLFLGFEVSLDYAKSLKAISAEVRSYYLSGDGIYLSEIVYEKKRYLGKFILSPALLENVRLLENNIYSILKKLIPDYPYQDKPLLLFSIDNL